MYSPAAKLWYLFSGKEKLKALLLTLLMMLVALLEVVGVGAIPAFVAVLSDPERAPAFGGAARIFAVLGAETHEQRVLWAAGVLTVVFLGKNTFLAVFADIQARFVATRRMTLANRLFRAYLSAPYTFHLQRNTAQLIHNTNNESSRVVNEGLLPCLIILREVLIVLGVLVLLAAVEPSVSFAMLFFLGGSSLLFFRIVRRKISELGQDEHHYAREMLQSASQGLGAGKEVKVLGREQFFLDAFATNVLATTRASRHKSVIFELPRLFLETIAVFAMLAVAVFFVHQGRSIQAVVPVLTLLGVAAIRFIPSANRLVSAIMALRWGAAAIDSVFRDLQHLDGAKGGRKAAASRPAPPFRVAIELVDVSYRYEGASEEALKRVSLCIPSGAVVGFVGPSGAGKTTAVDVILGLLDPTEGSVRIDGTELQECLTSWQRQIGYIPQSIYLADDTIRRNVAFGVPDDTIDEQKLRDAIEAAQLSDLVRRIPGGLDTVVGERGIRISGGQRQRIGIARALYHEPAVLVMDEATSAVDNETERDIVRALDHLRGNRTLIIIAHRLTTVKNCDILFFLREGRVEARGTYRELFEFSHDFRSMAAASA